DEVGIVGEQGTGEAAQHAGDDKANQPVPVNRKSDRLHALLVGAQPLNHQAETRIDDARHQIDSAEQAAEAEIIKLHAARQVDQAAEIAALVDRQPVVA